VGLQLPSGATRTLLLEAVGAVFFPRIEKPPMTETLTIPAHIENGSVRLDAPLPEGIISVELRVRRMPEVASSRPWKSVGDFVRSLPSGNRSGAEIEAQVREERESWPE
jgi:hypothetical protein